MTVKIIFLILLCMPAIYIAGMLIGKLAGEIVQKQSRSQPPADRRL